MMTIGKNNVKITKLIFTIIILSLFTPLLCFASPTLSNTTGTFSDGECVSIYGSGFSSGDTTPLLWDNFETGTNGNTLSETPQVGTWLIIGSGETLAKYSNSDSHSGTQSSIGTTTDTFLDSQFSSPTSDMTDTYYFISYWFKYDNDTQGQVKLVQLHGTYQQGDYNPGFMAGAFATSTWSAYIALENSGTTEQEYYDDVSKNVWHLCELKLKQSTVNTADGEVTMLIDGVVVYSKTNVKTRERTDESWQKMLYFYGYTNAQSGVSKSTVLDDVYLNNSWSMVVIGNNATYANCTHREIQIPTAWSSTSITIDVNTGSFATDDTAYLFVIDSDGVASTGYEITIGGESIPDDPTPTDTIIDINNATIRLHNAQIRITEN